MFDTGCGVIALLWPRENTSTAETYNLFFGVADVWSLWQEMAESVPIVFGLRQNPWGDDSFCIADPDANKLTLFTERKPT
jgi:hypothetical protein